jgi:hypothetical protein
MSHTWTDILSAVSTSVAALAAIAIPIVLYRWAKLQNEHSEKREIESRTLNEIDKLDSRVNRAVTEIMKRTKDDFTYDKISGDAELEGFVFELLNQYAYVCLGANKGLFSKHIIMELRGNALRKTKEQYVQYIGVYRSKHDAEAWIDIDTFLSAASS